MSRVEIHLRTRVGAEQRSPACAALDEELS